MPQLLVYLKVLNLMTMNVNEKADKSSKYLVQFAVRCNSYPVTQGHCSRVWEVNRESYSQNASIPELF